MHRLDEVRIAPKRDRLLGIFCGSLLSLPITYMVLHAVLAAAQRDQSFFQTATAVVLILAAIVTVPYMVLFALWAFVRLALNLPALILTPEGIVNHSIVYHVVIPWHEIDQFVRNVSMASPSAPGDLRRRGQRADTDILVLGHDQRRLHTQQQPLTRALLWLFRVLRPVNINTDVMAATQEEVWAQLERYAHETVGNTRIKFVTIGSQSSART